MAYLLLLHELRVGAVIDDVTAKNGCGQDGVDLLCVHVAQLAVQDEIVALGTETDSHFLSKEDKGENVAMLQRGCQRKLVLVT